jgi:phosphoribosylformylglycinamidine cyclo-ligase
VPLDRYRRPVMVSGTDGVGTKLRLAIETGRHDTIGIDLVAMCVNDVLVQGAEPLFFLDYYATGRLDVEVAARVIEGIVAGCLQAGCALVGGETAEMPGMYGGEDYDLAGFCVGLVEKDAIIDGRQTRAGDAIIGLASSGAHSNGYSLIRKLLADTGSGPQTTVGGANLHELLLTPTRIYVRAVQALLREVPVHSIAHITGGGPNGNIPRTLPPGVEAMIDPRRWSRPMVFDWLQAAGRIEDAEMYRTFNCGLGMTLCVAPGDADRALAILAAQGETASVIGEVRRGDRGVVVTG